MRFLGGPALVLACALACPAGPGEGEGEGEGEREGEGEGEGEGDPAPGFGIISGACDLLGAELTSAQPSFFSDVAIDFGANPYDDGDLGLLSAGAQEIIADGNAGGSSVVSEAITFDLLARCEGASLIKTENEIEYTVAGTTITDFTVAIDGVVVAVNPVRTFVFPAGSPLTFDEAMRRLEGKLDDVLVSSANVAPADEWSKQIIAVIAAEPEHVQVVRDVWDSLDTVTRHDTIVYLYVTLGDDAFIAAN